MDFLRTHLETTSLSLLRSFSVNEPLVSIVVCTKRKTVFKASTLVTHSLCKTLTRIPTFSIPSNSLIFP